MDAQGFLAVAILAAVVALLVRRTLPVEVVALGIPLVLLATRVLTSEADALAGFRSNAIVSIGSMFIVGEGLREAGVTTLMAQGLQRVGGGDRRLVAALMVAAAALSSLMSTAAVVAVLVSAVVTLARRTARAPSRLLMPLSFGAVMGCNMLMISSVPNLFVADQAHARLGLDLGIFASTLPGLAVLAAGTAFMVLFGRRLLPTHDEDPLGSVLEPEAVVAGSELARRLFRLVLVPRSRIRGRTLAESGLRARYGLDVIAVVRRRWLRRAVLEPRPDLMLATGDELFVEGDDEAAWTLADGEDVQFGLASPTEMEELFGLGMTVAEVMPAPRSRALGQTLRQLAFRSRHGLNALALVRPEGRVPAVADTPLQVGDALVVAGAVERVRELAREPADWIVLTDHSSARNLRRAPVAVAALALAVLPPALGLLPLALSALTAACLLVATRCVSLERAQQAIDWRVLFIIAGTVPLGLALEHHGVAHLAAQLVGSLSAAGGVATVAGLFVLASALSMLTTNSTAAVIVTPVAITLAQAGVLDPRRALLAVAFGANCTYALPMQAGNLLVMGPGGYRPADFLRVGAGVTVVVAITGIAAVWLLA